MPLSDHSQHTFLAFKDKPAGGSVITACTGGLVWCTYNKYAILWLPGRRERHGLKTLRVSPSCGAFLFPPVV